MFIAVVMYNFGHPVVSTLRGPAYWLNKRLFFKEASKSIFFFFFSLFLTRSVGVNYFDVTDFAIGN